MVWYAKLVQLRSHPRMRKRTTDDAKVAKKDTLHIRTGTTAKKSRLRRRNQVYAVYNTKIVVATLWALNPELSSRKCQPCKSLMYLLPTKNVVCWWHRRFWVWYAHLCRRQQQTQRKNGRNGIGKKNRKRLTDNHEFPQYAAFIASQTSEQSCYSDDVKRPMCSS